MAHYHVYGVVPGHAYAAHALAHAPVGGHGRVPGHSLAHWRLGVLLSVGVAPELRPRGSGRGRCCSRGCFAGTTTGTGCRRGGRA